MTSHPLPPAARQPMGRPHLHIDRTFRFAAPVLVILACVLAFGNSLNNGFVYDDHFVVVQNDHIHSVDLIQIFGSEYWGGFAQENVGTYYRPVTILSFALDWTAWGQNAFGYHLSNLVVHIAVTLLLYLLGMKLTRNRNVALLAALLFAVHPVHTEAVSNISGRSDLLVALFSLCAVLCFLRDVLWSKILTPVAVFLALCSKEIALVLPVLLVLCDLLWKPATGRFTRAFLLRRIWTHHLGLWISVAVFLALRTVAVGNLKPVPPSPLDNPLVEASFVERIMTMPVLVLHDLRLLLFPASLSVDYSFNQIPVVHSPAHPGFLAGLLVLFALAYILLRIRPRSPVVLFGLALLCVPLAPTLNPFLPAGTILAERYLYLPSAGFCLLAAMAGLWLLELFRRPYTYRIAMAALTLILALGVVRTALRNQDWLSDETLFRSAVDASPNSVRARLNLSFILSKQNDIPGAITQYCKILAIRPDYPVVLFNLAEAYKELKDPHQAQYYYEQAVRVKPGFVEGWTTLAGFYLDRGREVEAESAYRVALNLAPQNASLYNQLGLIYQQRGDYAAAGKAYEQAISGNFQHPGVFCNLGVAYAYEGRLDEARKAYELALKLQPNLAIAHFHLANLLRSGGHTTSAIEHYRAFLQYWTADPKYLDMVRESLRQLENSA